MDYIVFGSENVDANSMSECSAMKVVETNAVCILTAIDSKLTDRDKEGECIIYNAYKSVFACVMRRRREWWYCLLRYFAYFY